MRSLWSLQKHGFTPRLRQRPTLEAFSESNVITWHTYADESLACPPALLKIFLLPLLIALAGSLHAQTYKVEPDASATHQNGQTQTQGQPLGWGSNIQTARLARAAQLALQRGDHAQAVDYAQQAAQADSSDPQLWFLLGYAARLDARFQLSEAAYTRGLRLNPAALDGLSGLAQTYSVVGRSDEAEHLLKQVISSDPKRRDDVQLLGSLYLRAGDYTNAILWLRRAESMQPNARAELLLGPCVSTPEANESGQPLSRPGQASQPRRS